MRPILEAVELRRTFKVRGMGRRGVIRAVDGVSLSVHHGRTLALVGESACGKSTTARLLLRLEEPTSGRILADGIDVTTARGAGLDQFRAAVQVVFQDPISSLNPRKTVARTIAGSLSLRTDLNRSEWRGEITSLLARVGLQAGDADRFPHEFSGGQCQRIAIARALAANPRVIVCDEPASALDVSVQAQILDLLRELQDDLGLSLLFISHDLAVVRQVADEVAVMYLGRIVERGSGESLFSAPMHPYTQGLLSSVPIPDPTRRVTRAVTMTGELPDPTDLPKGCRYRTRCRMAREQCAVEDPPLRDLGSGRSVACHFAEEAAASFGSGRGERAD